MYQKRIYKTFPFEPSPKMYQDMLDKIEYKSAAQINEIYGVGSTSDDWRPRAILIASLRLKINPLYEYPDLQRIQRSFVNAVGDFIEYAEPKILAKLIGEKDYQAGNLVKSMLIDAIVNLEKAMAGKAKVKQL